MTTTPHDALFKATFSQVEHAAPILRALLPPEVAARIDWATLAVRAGSFIDEALAGRHTDLLFSVRVAGHEALIYVLFEHQSTPDSLMPFRLLRYVVRISETHLRDRVGATKLPAILPVVLHHGPGGWTAATSMDEVIDLDDESLALFADYLPRFRFVLDDLAHHDDKALHDRTMTALGRLVLLCFKHARSPDDLVERLGRWTDLVREVWKAPNGVAALALVVRYVYEVGGERTIEALRQLAGTQVGRDAEEAIVSYAEQLRNEGRREGQREGELKGRAELFLSLLRIRFGELPDSVAKRVTAAALEQLDRWVPRVLTAPTLDDVFAA